ncbi:MAG TPA: molecular chaperone DnaK, partial [Anaerolineae bacterium]|nr:molecular chaperone DnaK [Anaerolineae bacterium]
MSRAIGIDFGTTNSAMAYMHRGEPRVILNQDNMDVTPSAVSLSRRGELLVGKAAKVRALLDPENTVLSIKRKMGTNERVQFNGRMYTPTEIAALILRRMKEDAEKRLGERI